MTFFREYCDEALNKFEQIARTAQNLAVAVQLGRAYRNATIACVLQRQPSPAAVDFQSGFLAARSAI